MPQSTNMRQIYGNNYSLQMIYITFFTPTAIFTNILLIATYFLKFNFLAQKY